MSGREVEIIGILSSSQGKIAVVSALLAGIGYSVLTSLSSEELVNSSYLGIFFIISSTSVVAGNIFVAIICSMSEQEGEVAHAMSLLRDNRQFDLQLEKWWQKFSPLRTRSVWIFYFSVPLLFLSVALLSLIKWPAPFSYIIASLFFLFGVITTQNIFWLSSIFRSDVLLIETFQEVKFNTKLKRVLSTRDSSRYNLKSPPPKHQEKFQSKIQTSFHFNETTETPATTTTAFTEIDSYEEIDTFSLPQSTATGEVEAPTIAPAGEASAGEFENQQYDSPSFQRISSQKSTNVSRSSSPYESRQGNSFRVLVLEEEEESGNERIEVFQDLHGQERSTTSSKRKRSKKKKN
jgi:hypothetical protein